MSNTNQRLASRSFLPVSIDPGQVLNVPTGLQDKDGNALTPWIVQPIGPCPFLQILQKNADGSFDIWNPTANIVNFDWTAHHLHSVEQEPLTPVATVATPSTVPAPAQLCEIPGWENQPDYLLGSYWLTVLETNEAARQATPSTILTDTDPDALNNAVAAASAGDVIEVRTNATYNPVTIPAATELIIRAGTGYTPSISGQEALKLTNGASKVVISGFTFSGCSTPQTNYSGAAVTFAALNAIVDNIIFDRCNFQEVQNGSAVMLSYHWSQGGDNYQNPPQPGEESENISFIECTFDTACKEATEGAAIALRPVRRAFIYDCDINGQNYAVGNGCRGVQLQNCPEAMVHSSEIYNMIGNGEGVKFDTIGGAPVALYPTGQVIKNRCHDCIEGIDVDDNSFVTCIDNQCYDNTDEGISVDDSAVASLTNNTCWNNNDGILLEAGAVTELHNNHCYANPNNNYNILNGYTLPTDNIDGLTVPTETDPVEKKQGMIPADMLSVNQTEEKSNGRWNGPQPASVDDALTKIVNNQYAPFEPSTGSANQGDVLYRDANQWNRLAPGNAGEFLQTQGAGANPLWAVAAGGGLNLAPTFVVGSADAIPADTASDCDFLHQNGVTDGITAAINAALAAGRGRIYIRRGTYLIPGAQNFWNINQPITIEGEGMNETIIQLQNTATQFNVSWFYLDSNFVRVQNLSVLIPDSAMAITSVFAIWKSHNILQNVQISYGGTNTRLGSGAVYVSASLEVMEGTKLYNVLVNTEKIVVPVRAFYFDDSGSKEVTNIKMDRCYGYAQASPPAPVQVPLVEMDRCEDVLVENCDFETDGSQSGPAIFISQTNNTTRSKIKVRNNKVDQGYIEVYLTGSDKLEDSEICGNEIHGAAYGIKFSPQASQAIFQYGLIERNKILIDDQVATGIHMERCWFTECTKNNVNINFSDASPSTGILNNLGTDNSIQGNTVRMNVTTAQNHVGIENRDSSRCKTNNNTVTFGTGATQGIGILLNRLSVQTYYNNITGNNIFARGAIAKGIKVQWVTFAAISQSINSNVIEMQDTGSAVQGDVAGIEVQNGTLKTTIDGNTINAGGGANGVGVFLTAGGATCTGVLDSNSITPAGGTAIIPAGAPGTFIYGNNHIA